jgi:two-component system sensor histidine kinase KdpD
LLVIELARRRSGIKGSRHHKRWQDVHRLLDVDVWSALNVQLESLNGTVGAITVNFGSGDVCRHGA